MTIAVARLFHSRSVRRRPAPLHPGRSLSISLSSIVSKATLRRRECVVVQDRTALTTNQIAFIPAG